MSWAFSQNNCCDAMKVTWCPFTRKLNYNNMPHHFLDSCWMLFKFILGSSRRLEFKYSTGPQACHCWIFKNDSSVFGNPVLFLKIKNVFFVFVLCSSRFLFTCKIKEYVKSSNCRDGDVFGMVASCGFQVPADRFICLSLFP